MAEDTFAERLWEGIDEELRRYDISEEIIANIKKDFIRSFAVGGPAVTKIPGVPGAVIANLRINLYNLATAPRKVADSVATVLTRTFLGLPYAEYAAAEQIAGEWLADRVNTVYTDAWGRPIFSPGTEKAFRRWVISSPDRGERRKTGKELGRRLDLDYRIRPGEVHRWGMAEIRKASDPGFITFQATELEKRGLTEIAGRPINEVFRESHFASRKQEEHRQNWERELAKAQHYEAVGDLPRAKAQTANAEYIRKSMEKDWDEWWKKSKPYRDYFTAEPRRNMEEQLAKIRVRYYQLKEYIRLRSITLGVLNFFRTLHEEGWSGVFREYVWLTTINFIFRERTPLYYLYPPNLVSIVMGKIPVPGLGTINQLRARIAAKILQYQARIKQWLERKILRKLREKWRKFVAVPLKQLAKRAVNWLITKLGLKVILAKIGAAIGAAIGTVSPGIGNVIGAVVGAVTIFVVGIVVEKIWKPVFRTAAMLLVSACGCLALIASGVALFIVIVMASVFAPGMGGPGAGPPPLPPVYQVTVEKRPCYKKVVLGEEEWFCANRHKIENNTGVHEIRWEIAVTNGSEQTAEVVISDEECNQTWSYTGDNALAPGEKMVPGCVKNYDTNNLALHNTTVYNTVTGTATIGGDSRDLYAVGILIIGNPPDAPPCGYPAGTAMTVTSPFMATDVCRMYDYWCGTEPMAGCSVGGVSDVTGVHSGLDLNSNFNGSPLYSTINGTVMHIQSGGGGDWCYITVCNANWCILYGHTFCSFPVSVGQTVNVGQQVAYLDSTGDVTGPHVHYMVWDDPAIFTWANFSDCAPNCCTSPLHNPANFLGPCD